MDRTRLVFFAVLAVILLVVGASLALEWIGEAAALQLFVAATVFSAGVVLLDFLGVLGAHHGDGFAGHLESASDGAGSVHADDAGVIDAAEIASPGDAGGDHIADHASVDPESGEQDHAAHHDAHHASPGAPILSVIAYLRLLVYFCLGFGPTGWVAMSTGRGALSSIALATPVGLLAVLIAQAFFRFQRHDTDSQITADDLLTAEATVIVPLDSRTMGKIRARVGMGVVDRYALAADAGATFGKGAKVRVVSIVDDTVYVR
jgi:hypothetical protein